MHLFWLKHSWILLLGPDSCGFLVLHLPEAPLIYVCIYLSYHLTVITSKWERDYVHCILYPTFVLLPCLQLADSKNISCTRKKRSLVFVGSMSNAIKTTVGHVLTLK
jgi:hypothetical protein